MISDSRLDGAPQKVIESLEQPVTKGVAEEIPHSRLISSPPGWPELASDALEGLPGDIVNVIRPYTEADPVALLINLLVGFGNLVGSGPHYRVEETKHPPRLFAVLLGESSKGRKGQSWSTPRRLFADVDKAWEQKVTSGLSSGEGLIYHVRDSLGADCGVSDKRVLVIEEELSRTLRVAQRQENVLSAVLRQAWDSGDLRVLTKNNPLKATGAHVSIVGHITIEEVTRYLTATEQANGFGNRFLWLLVRRTQSIPNPTGVPEGLYAELVRRLQEAVRLAANVGEMKRDTEAESDWASIYDSLANGKPGLTGTLLARAESQVLRLSLVYALMDQSPTVRSPHLRAACAVWDYVEASVRYVFGASKTGDPSVDKITEALWRSGQMDETEIHSLFGRNAPPGEVDRALSVIFGQGLAVVASDPSRGRPRNVWRPTKKG